MSGVNGSIVAAGAENTNVIAVKQEGVSAPKVIIKGNGSATFAGNIDAGNVNFSLDDGSTLAVKDRMLNLISRLDASGSW